MANNNTENILKQLDNDANVIGYSPNLKYEKERTATGEAITGDSIENDRELNEDTFKYSQTLQGFANNMPSNVLDDIDYVLNNINRLKNNLAKAFNKERQAQINPFIDDKNKIFDSDDQNNEQNPLVDPQNTRINGYDPDYPDSNKHDHVKNPINKNDNYNDINGILHPLPEDNDYAKNFADFYDRIDGTVIPDLINKINDIENKLKNLRSNYGFFYYDNDHISTDEAKNKDKAVLNYLRTKERNNESSKINYMLVSYDSLLNKMVSYNVFRDNKNAIKCAKVIDSKEKTQATSSDINIISTLFNEVEEKLAIRARGYKRQDDLQMIQKSMYNYYEKRKHLNDLYNLFAKDTSSRYLGRKIMQYSDDLTEAICDVNRVLMYNQNYLDKITELEKEKYNIQKIYKSTSSNS